MAEHFDIAIIGAGASGLSVAAGAAQLGARVALIERDRMGGDCLNMGCVPSKALLAAAHAAESARQAGRFGIRLQPPEIDWPSVRAHVQGVIDAIAPTDSEERFRALGVTVFREQARFAAPDTLLVHGHRITGRWIVVAAGSRAAIPPIPCLEQAPYLTNATIFGLVERPEHLVILGGGPIGLEMADAFCGLGSRVTVVEAQAIAGKEDPELAAVLREALTRRGVTFHEGATVASAGPGPALTLAGGQRLTGSHLLVATGRTPELELLGLDAGNVRATRGGIATDRGLRSVTNRRVFAVGDIADPAGLGPRAFTHAGAYHASIVIRRALFRLPARISYAALPRVTYTSPELAQVGMTESEAEAAGFSPVVMRWQLAQNDRAIAERATEGLIKLVAERGRLLGAGIAAPHAGEMIGQFTLAVARRTRISALASLIAPYPTLAEAAKRAAGEFYAPKLFSARTRRLVRFLLRLP